MRVRNYKPPSIQQFKNRFYAPTPSQRSGIHKLCHKENFIRIFDCAQRVCVPVYLFVCFVCALVYLKTPRI